MSKIKKTGLRNVYPDRPLSAMTLARLEEIAEQIQAHENNIAYLQSMAACRNALRRIKCQRIIPAFQSRSADQTRLPRTLSNLAQQIDCLNYEREVLKRYGR